jgi:integrase
MKWTKVAENLVRHPGGTIYLRAKVGGRKIRQSLGTTDLRQAKRKRDAELEALRHAAALGGENLETLADTLALEKELTLAKPSLKPRTRDYYAYLFAKIAESLPGHKNPATWTAEDARKWWGRHCTANPSAIHANNALAVMRRMMKLVIERGIRRDDPTKGIRRLKVPKTRIDDLPSQEQMEELVEHIRSRGMAHSEESAHMVAFLAWSGLRISELQRLRWEDVDDPWITIIGGKSRAKNETHQIPLNGRLRAILAARRWDGAHGPIFRINTPRIALDAACKRLGMRHLRIHDLRHWFASHCIEKGIDVVTLAHWLGHKDGGKTLLATYAHHQKLHSLSSAEKLGG